MRKHKKFFVLITFAIIMLLSFSMTTCATESPFNVTINNEVVEFTEEMGYPYFTETNRTMVPVRIVSENMGYEVDWDNKTQTVFISNNNKKIELQIGKSTATINGKSVPIDVQDGKPVDTKTSLVPVKGSSRTYVPLRFVSEAMGAEVLYEKINAVHNISIVFEKNKKEAWEQSLEVHYIDVGQGDAILIKQDEYNMLIDAGDNKYEKTVVAYLKDKGVTKLDYVIGTHPHADHIGGLDAVIDSFDIGKIIMPKVTHTSKTYEDVLIAIKNKGLKISSPIIGGNYELGEATFTIIAPNGEKYKDYNNYSVVLRMEFGENSFLFTGDAETLSEKEILNNKHKVEAQVLKVGHHGSNTSTSIGFLDAVNPEYAIIQVGADNKYGHPNIEIINRLEEHKIKIFRNDLHGDIILISDGENLEFIKAK